MSADNSLLEERARELVAAALTEAWVRIDAIPEPNMWQQPVVADDGRVLAHLPATTTGSIHGVLDDIARENGVCNLQELTYLASIVRDSDRAS